MDSEFRFEPSVGMTVYLQPIGNAARFWDGKLREGLITAVKRVYFYVEVGGDSRNVVRLEKRSCCNVDNDLNTGCIAFISEQAYLASQTKDYQLNQIRGVFTDRNRSERLPANTVTEIWNILFSPFDR